MGEVRARRPIRISAGTASLIGAFVAFAGVIAASSLAQIGAARLEDRRARTEIVLEIMRTSNREGTLEKLHILSASGLLDDEGEELIQAVTEADELAFRIVEVPLAYAVQCVDPDDIPPDLPPLNNLANDANAALAQALVRAHELKLQNDRFRGILNACISAIPAEESAADPQEIS